MQRSKQTFSLDDLTKHQQRIRTIVSRISQYQPDFHLNKNYKPQKNSVKKKIYQRRKNQDKLFQQNISLIEKIQSVQAKINTKKFPQINLQARQNRKHSSLSFKKQPNISIKQIKKRFQYKDQDQIFQQNIKIIQNIESIQSKIKCWQQKSLIKSRRLHQKNEQLKRKQILNKFKQIQKQINTLHVRKNASQISLIAKNKQSVLLNKKIISPYFQKSDTMKRTTSGQTAFEQKQQNKIKKSKAMLSNAQFKYLG